MLSICTMKKIILFCLLLVTGTIVHAQIQFGIKGGINYSAPFLNDEVARGSIDGSTNYLNTDYTAGIGFHFGVMVDIPLVGHFVAVKNKKASRAIFSVKPEVFVSLQHSTVSNNLGGSLDLTYIDIPVLAKINFRNGFYFEGGPYIGLLLNASQTGYTKVEANQLNPSIDYGACIGIGYLIKPIKLGMDGRINIGSAVPDNSDYINSINIQLGVFYLFGKEKY